MNKITQEAKKRQAVVKQAIKIGKSYASRKYINGTIRMYKKYKIKMYK